MTHPPIERRSIAQRLLLLALASSWLLVPAAARAATCSSTEFTCPPSGTCIITGTWNIGSGCTLDFGTRDVEIRGTFQANVLGGGFEVRAGNLILNGGKLKSLGNTATAGGAIGVSAAGAFITKGSGTVIDTSGNGGGGAFSVVAASIDLQTGIIRADGGTGEDCGDGGPISLQAFAGPLSSAIVVKSTAAGNQCLGGDIALTGDSVAVSGDLDAHGAGAGSSDAIFVFATATDITVSGGAVLNANGTGQADGYGADGGTVAFLAPLGSVHLGGASITAWGKSPYGNGGAFYVDAGADIVVASRVTIQGGVNATGGEVILDARGSLTISQEIDAAGGSADPDGRGGYILIDTLGPLLITADVDVSGLEGGEISAISAANVTVSGDLDAHGSRYSGGVVELAGCAIRIDGTLDTSASSGGAGGSIDLEGTSISTGYDAVLSSSPCEDGDCILLVTPNHNATIDPHTVISPPAEFYDFPVTCGAQ
jgi:hypothetical protein